MPMTNSPQISLFAEECGRTETQPPAVKPIAAGVARVLMPSRARMELRASDLESLLPEGRTGPASCGPLWGKRI
jgi:hypothetical protein